MNYKKALLELEAARASNQKVRRDARERISTLERKLKGTSEQAHESRESCIKLSVAGNNLTSAIERGDADLIDRAVVEWKKAIIIIERER